MTENTAHAAPSRTASPLLSIRSVEKSFGKTRVLAGISLQVAEKEFLTILGESGSGKTTLLRLIAGFESPDSGEIWMDEERLDLLPPYKRRVNTVFQQYALFPHLSVLENVAYGLRVRRLKQEEVASRVEGALAMVKMAAFSSAAPATLSGGQQQRVALARALVNRPRLLLLDEPLSALDANLRKQMQSELQSLQREVGVTFIFVTHDQQEAMALSDRIALLRAGKLEQVATPREIYQRPATAYAASFIGQTNLLRAAITQGRAEWSTLHWRTTAANGPATFSLRPECIRPRAALRQDSIVFEAQVCGREFQGASEYLKLRLAQGEVLSARLTGQTTTEFKEWEFLISDLVLVRD
ncbi:MAG: ABC transporter ATP-binding protein [Acidobacteriales bacterium]|nr:ABC transporter ATP-binding protein [Terriglobales bacterium]